MVAQQAGRGSGQHLPLQVVTGVPRMGGPGGSPRVPRMGGPGWFSQLASGATVLRPAVR